MLCGPIDWAATGQFWAGVGTFVGAGALIYAAKLGKNAISDYREQKLAEREIEVAEQVLTAAYRAKDAIDGMRARFMPAGELHATEEQLKELGLKLDGMPEAENSTYVQRGVFYRRAEFFKDDFDSVFDMIPIGKVFFGDECETSLRSFPKARNQILSSADMLPMMANTTGPEDNDLHMKVRRDLYGKWTDEDDDPIGQSVTEGIAQLEAALLPIIRAGKE